MEQYLIFNNSVPGCTDGVGTSSYAISLGPLTTAAFIVVSPLNCEPAYSWDNCKEEITPSRLKNFLFQASGISRKRVVKYRTIP
jgi:hypothetical protein